MSSSQKKNNVPKKGVSSGLGRGPSASAAAEEETSAAAGEQDTHRQTVAGDQVSGSLTEENLRQLSNTAVFHELPSILSQQVAPR